MQRQFNLLIKYYMLQRADFTTAFLDLADEELQQPANECRFNKLRN